MTIENNSEPGTASSNALIGKEAVESIPLGALFDHGHTVYQRVDADELSGSSEEVKKELQQGCDWLQRCQERVDQLGLFSTNEELEDVTTADLKYLLVPFFLGELLQRLNEPERLSAIRSAQSHLMAFIGRCEQLGLLSEGERAAMGREGPADPATRRTEKIARFKKQKEVRQQLEGVRQRRAEKQQQQQQQRRRRSLPAGDGEGEGGEGEEGLEDEQEERKARLLEIDLAVGKALDLLEGLQREETMLAAAAYLESDHMGDGTSLGQFLDRRQRSAEEWHRAGRRQAELGAAAGAPPPRPITCATFAQDVIEGRASVGQPHRHHAPTFGFGPVSFMGGARPQTHRERLQAQVFQPSHSLPSMSIEEAGTREMEIMSDINRRTGALGRQAGAEASAGSGSPESEGEEEEDEAAELKARAWDDWTDEHPRGMGNSKLTPCG